MDDLDKILKNLDPDKLNIEKILAGANEFFEKIDKCKKAGHPRSEIYSSDPLRYKVWYNCKDCNEMYERPMTAEQVKSAMKLMNMRFTI